MRQLMIKIGKICNLPIIFRSQKVARFFLADSEEFLVGRLTIYDDDVVYFFIISFGGLLSLNHVRL